ncbi:MAG TPA: 6-carboxytetrahydropterin synthase QueD [bacterium]|nr:6-carboxytetrahydropterin synthase QueD [bacterium]
MRFLVYRESTFSAAHHLRNYRGKCEKVHGHNWRVRLYVSRSELDPNGFVIDFKDLDAILLRVLDRLDHHDINEVAPFTEENPTAEHIARHLFTEAERELAGRDPACSVERVMVWESEKSCAIVERSA